MNDADPRYGGEVQRRMASFAGAAPAGAAAGAGFVTGRSGDREQGAEVVLLLLLAEGRVSAARYRAFGCPHLIAAASWLTERLVGCVRADLERWDWREAAAALDVPPVKFGRLLTLQDAVRDAAGNWPGDTASTV